MTRALLALALALPAASAALAAGEDPRVGRAWDYLSSLPPSTATFVQKDPDGGRLNGWIAIAPPLRARIEYEPPANQVLVADGTFLVFHDPDAGQTSHIPLSSTPLRALLGGEDRDGVEVLSVEEEGDAFVVQVALLDEDGERFPGWVALAFAEDPFRLAGWWVLDARNRLTEVRLDGLEPADFEDPRTFRLSPDMMDRGDAWLGPWKKRRVRPSGRRG